jgi:hypothetical protein
MGTLVSVLTRLMFMSNQPLLRAKWNPYVGVKDFDKHRAQCCGLAKSDVTNSTYFLRIQVFRLCDNENQSNQLFPHKIWDDVLFELPPLYKLMGVSEQMQGMDRKYDSHTWCKVKTTNIKKKIGLGFRSAKCLDHLRCANDFCFMFF